MPVKNAKKSTAEWKTFTAGCLAARSDLDDLMESLPQTVGMNGILLDDYMKLCRDFGLLMHNLQPLVEKNCDPQDPDFGQAIASLREAREPSRDCTKRGSYSKGAPLTREEWISVGEKFKACKFGFQKLAQQIQDVPGGKLLARQLAASRMWGRLSRLMDNVLVAQHPSWQGFSRVFYSETPADPDSL